MNKEKILSAGIVALSIVILGLFIKSGFSIFAEKDRTVDVKGLAEREMKADMVTWPLMRKDAGNNLEQLVAANKHATNTILSFLKSNGIKASDILVNPAEIVDNMADRYAANNIKFRYNISQIVTVRTKDVDRVRRLIAMQGDLVSRGVVLSTDDYRAQTRYEFLGLNKVKPEMIAQATKNARQAAEKFASDSESKLGKIKSASQGQFSITDRDENTPYIKKLRVVTTVVYFLDN